MNINRVAPLRAMVLSHRVIVRQLLTVGRSLALGALGAAVILVAWAVGASESSSTTAADELDTALASIVTLGFAAVIPVVTLVFAGAALGDMREDATLVYLWLRPMDRWPIVLGAVGAAITVSLPFTVLPVAVAAAMFGVGSELVASTIIAGCVGVVAYSAVFVLFGLLVKNSISWGLAYIIVWEGVAAGFGTFANRMAIRGYTGSILNDRLDGSLSLADLSQGQAILSATLISIVAVVVASARLNRLDVA